MFTGLIEDIGRVRALARRGEAGVLQVETSLPLTEIACGDSVAVNGICLTVVRIHASGLSFDVSPETMLCSTLGHLRTGQHVNLERAMRLGDRLGGHIVTGHIDCTARLSNVSETSGNRVMEFSLPHEHLRLLVTKGSVAINGTSLTINAVTASGFSINLIPLTQTKTNLSLLKAGDEVNIETDIIGKYVERLIQPWKPSGGLTIKALAENGFI
ncbi:MAG TPA: riboflavin synthase [Deltaproteobacteria bacterium]|nr:riboflavin synthase [Deltaproteobacteria bacterium]HQB38116.1 riboflavin synthase [Deltaproteobacteria bacterium]